MQMQYFICNIVLYHVFLLGAFQELPKVTISFVMYVCPCTQNNSAPTGQTFMKFGI